MTDNCIYCFTDLTDTNRDEHNHDYCASCVAELIAEAATMEAHGMMPHDDSDCPF
jgi:hypothetical protein